MSDSLDPYYLIETTDAADPEDRLDVYLAAATALRPGEGGLLPQDLARALAQAARAVPFARRAALVWRQSRRLPGMARASRN